jgi:hypothetical protein
MLVALATTCDRVVLTERFEIPAADAPESPAVDEPVSELLVELVAAFLRSGSRPFVSWARHVWTSPGETDAAFLHAATPLRHSAVTAALRFAHGSALTLTDALGIAAAGALATITTVTDASTPSQIRDSLPRMERPLYRVA